MTLTQLPLPFVPDQRDQPALWPHQVDAVRAATEALTGGGRGHVVMACGTGKTRVAAEASARLAPSGRVLVVVPTLELLAQTAREWAGFLGPGLGRLVAVCSDPGVARQAHGHEALHGLEPVVTTDPDELAAALDAPGRCTVIATYVSLTVLTDYHRSPRSSAWDLAVIDEAHRAVGDRRRPWSAINRDPLIPTARRLYMTATPRIYDADAGAESEVVGMDDPTVFGPELYRLDFAKAIDLGMLSDYRVLAALVTDTEVAALTAGTRHLDLGGRAVPAATVAAQVALGKAIKAYDLRRVITFHHRVAGAQRFAASLSDAVDLLADDDRPHLPVRGSHLSGDSTPQARRAILGRLAHPGDQVQVVANARLLSEGVDVPELDAVMFTDPRNSQVDVVQAVGRALRRGTRHSKVATIVIPVFLAEGESPEAALEGSAFDVVWRVVRALRAHDERLGGWLDTARAQLFNPDHSEPQVPQKLPEWMRIIGAEVSGGFAAAVHLRTVTVSTSGWPEFLAAARAFQARHGHLRPSREHREGRVGLKSWISYARLLYRSGRLPSDRVAALEEMGLEWAPNSSSFDRALAALDTYRRTHGHVRVPVKYVTEEGFQLGCWVCTQRKRWRRGELTDERIARLKELGVCLDEFSWVRFFAAAKSFHARHGHLRVPDSHVEDGLQLGRRLQKRRTEYRRGELPAERIAALEQLGVVWNPRATWAQAMQACRAFVAEHGHLCPAQGTVVNGVNLSDWVGNRRGEYRRGTLSAERIAALEALGMVWSVAEQAWRERLEDLAEFHADHGHLIIPEDHIGKHTKGLSRWLQERRAAYRRGEMPAGQVAALEAISADWHRPSKPRGLTRAERVARGMSVR